MSLASAMAYLRDVLGRLARPTLDPGALADSEKWLSVISDWGVAEDWSDWADAPG